MVIHYCHLNYHLEFKMTKFTKLHKLFLKHKILDKETNKLPFDDHIDLI